MQWDVFLGHEDARKDTKRGFVCGGGDEALGQCRSMHGVETDRAWWQKDSGVFGGFFGWDVEGWRGACVWSGGVSPPCEIVGWGDAALRQCRSMYGVEADRAWWQKNLWQKDSGVFGGFFGWDVEGWRVACVWSGGVSPPCEIVGWGDATLGQCRSMGDDEKGVFLCKR